MEEIKELRLDLDYLASTYNIDLTDAEIHRVDGRMILVLEGTRR